MIQSVSSLGTNPLIDYETEYFFCCLHYKIFPMNKDAHLIVTYDYNHI